MAGPPHDCQLRGRQTTTPDDQVSALTNVRSSVNGMFGDGNEVGEAFEGSFAPALNIEHVTE